MLMRIFIILCIFFFQSRVSRKTNETANSKNTSNINSFGKTVITNHIDNNSKESEVKCIKELIFKNNELKNLILKV